MPAKSRKTSKTPKAKKTAYVNLYELLATFSAGVNQLVQHVEEKDRARLRRILGDALKKHGFYELGGHRGHECVINTAHLVRINVLDYLPGIQFEAEPEDEDEEAFRRLEEREADDTPVILRIWVQGQAEPEVQPDVDYAAWCCIRQDLLEDSRFIEFEDEDGEQVFYGVDHLDAVEAIDPYYLNEEQVKTLLNRYDSEGDDSQPQSGDLVSS